MAETPGLQGGFDQFEHHLVAGSELLRQSRVKEAQAQLLSALELQPNNAKALALLGLAYFRGGMFHDAAPVYEALVAQAPADAGYRLNLGLVHLKLGKANAAIEELNRCRELDPSQSRAVGYLGLAYTRAGRYAEAYQAFLQSGQEELAQEVVHHLTDQERIAIEAAVRVPADVMLSQPSIKVPVAKVAPAEPHETIAAAAADATREKVAPSTQDAAPPEPEPEPELEFRAEPLLPTRVVVEPDPARVHAAHADASAISLAVASAVPSSAAAVTGTRVAPGGRPPQPLSEFATARLVRPEEGDHPFEISAGGVLMIRVDGRIYARTEGVDVTGGDLSYEPATRRVRGAQTQEAFATGERQMYVVSGKGLMIASALGGEFTAVQLDDDIFYLREDVVFAFEPTVRWENGHVPGSRARIPMVQFRGGGAVVFRTPRPLLAIKLAPERVLYVDANALAGWIGRVVPRAVAPAGTSRLSELFVECTGEGVVLVQEDLAISPAAPVHAAAARATSSPPPEIADAPAPSGPPAEATLSLD